MEQLSGLDSFMLYDEQGNVYNHVAALGIYDPSTSPNGKTRFKEILQHFKNRMVDFPIFRRRLVTVPYGIDRPYWVEDAEIDVEFHIRHIALPHPGDWRQLMIQVARLHSRPLDRSRPLWEIYVIEGLDKIPGLHAGCFALFMKFHHASVDGQAAAALLQAVHAGSPTEHYVPRHPGHDDLNTETPSPLTILGNAARNAGNRTLGLSSLYLSTAMKVGGLVWDKLPKPFSQHKAEHARLPLSAAPQTRFNHPVSANRVVDAVALRLDEIKQIRQAIPGITINDVFLAVCGGALRKYLNTKGELPDESLRALMPISLGEKIISKRKLANNQVGGAPVELRTDLVDPLERLHAVHREAASAKRTAEALGLDLLQGLMDNLPEAAGRALLRRGLLRLLNVAASNVRGPDTPLYVAGARLLHYYPVSIASDYVGLNMSGFTYNGVLWICAVACRNMMPDPHFFASCLRDSFAELLAAARQAPRTSSEPARPVGSSGRSKPLPVSTASLASAPRAARKATAKPASRARPAAKTAGAAKPAAAPSVTSTAQPETETRQ